MWAWLLKTFALVSVRFFLIHWNYWKINFLNFWKVSVQFSSVAQSCPTLCNPHEPQRARPPCPSPTPGVHSDSRPSSRWCHPAISSSVIPFSSCPQSLPASESFQWINSFHEVAKVQEFSFSIIPSKEIPGLISFRMDWLDLLAVQGTLRQI